MADMLSNIFSVTAEIIILASKKSIGNSIKNVRIPIDFSLKITIKSVIILNSFDISMEVEI